MFLSKSCHGSLSHLLLTHSPPPRHHSKLFNPILTRHSSSSPMTEIRSNQNLNTLKLVQYLSANGIDGFQNHSLCKIQQFSHGQSNPTFMIIADNGKKFTIRKQPSGLLTTLTSPLWLLPWFLFTPLLTHPFPYPLTPFFSCFIPSLSAFLPFPSLPFLSCSLSLFW